MRKAEITSDLKHKTSRSKTTFKLNNLKPFWFRCLMFGFIFMFEVGILIFGLTAEATAKAYDGIWFLGFNLKHEIFKHQKVRQAVNSVVDKGHIAKEIVSEEAVPISIIPPGMLGYDSDLEPVPQDVKYAKLLMKKAGYPINDKRLKTLSLLHTDGLKTVDIAQKIQSNLRGIGMKVKLVEVSYRDESKWIRELVSGDHDLFLMGYKGNIEKLFTEEATTAEDDSYSLVEPLFKTAGDANFVAYSNSEVDKLLDQLSGINIALKNERHVKLKKINQQLYKDLPVVVLFYIEKL